MASQIIGRATCPECGFASAHVKKSEKCIYRYCPECGAQHHARTERQSADLLAKTRMEGAPTPREPSPSPTGTAPAATEAAAPTPKPTPTGSEPTATATPPKRRGLFS